MKYQIRLLGACTVGTVVRFIGDAYNQKQWIIINHNKNIDGVIMRLCKDRKGYSQYFISKTEVKAYNQ